MLPDSSQIDKERVAQVAHLMAQAMRRDVQAQGGLIVARTLGRTEAVYRTCSHPGTEELGEEKRLLREQIQCSTIRVHLAYGKMRAEFERSKALCAAMQPDQSAASSRIQTWFPVPPPRHVEGLD